jgi:hypothetical protein
MTGRKVKVDGDLGMDLEVSQHRPRCFLMHEEGQMSAIVVNPRGPRHSTLRLKVIVSSSDVDGKPGLEKVRDLVRN